MDIKHTFYDNGDIVIELQPETVMFMDVIRLTLPAPVCLCIFFMKQYRDFLA